jgi:predicted RecB family nuclease
MSARLSKSRFQKGLQCEKALWLSVHEPESADPIPESRQWVFDQGTEVGRVAHGLFPGGTEVSEDYLHSAEALATTETLLAEGARVLYEPAFSFDGVLVRVDILVRVDSGTSADGDGASGDAVFDLYEVKSTTKLKPEHVTDAAIQTYVVEGVGLRIRRSNIVHLDTTYVYEGGDYDPSRLFLVEDVTEEARAFMPLVHDTLERFRRMLEGPEPEVRIGQQCSSPYACDFAGRCHAFLPAEHPITDLPRLGQDTLHRLLDEGILCIRDIPDMFLALTPAQRSAVRVVKNGAPEVDVAGLARDLAALGYPIYHLDFETFMSALPLWPGGRPYELTPFQYSIHVEHEDGSTEHREYLHGGSDDPRRPLTERLLRDLDETGSVVHYTSYERRVLDALAIALPDLAQRIALVKSRLFDLEAVVRNRTRHPQANGRTSIKAVLPAWCDDVSYDDLGIKDGQTASIRYLQAMRGLLSTGERQQVLDDLAAYCGTDTLAMVRLLDTLRALAQGAAPPA